MVTLKDVIFYHNIYMNKYAHSSSKLVHNSQIKFVTMLLMLRFLIMLWFFFPTFWATFSSNVWQNLFSIARDMDIFLRLNCMHVHIVRHKLYHTINKIFFYLLEVIELVSLSFKSYCKQNVKWLFFRNYLQRDKPCVCWI